MFTLDNTSGFTEAQIEIMNKALAILVADGMDGKNASDHINNRWIEGATVESLIA